MHNALLLYALRMTADLRHLRALVAICDEGTFTDAAIALDLSQAQVSRTLAALEAELGRRLVNRSTRHVTLTPAGTIAVSHARRILDEVAALTRAMETGQREVRLGYAWAALGERTTSVLDRWTREHPETELTLVLAHTRTAGLIERTCDVAVMRRPVDDARLDGVLVGTEGRVAAVPAGDPLAKKRTLRLSDLDGRVVAVDVLTGTTSTALWSEESGPSKYLPTTGVDEWLTLIEAGRAVGITAEATRHQHPRAGVVFRQVRDAAPMPVTLVWRRSDPPPLLADLIRIIAESYAE